MLSEEHEPVNIGNPVEVTILEIAQTINTLTHNDAGIIFIPEQRLSDDPQRRKPDITRAKQILGWEPHVSLSEGLLLTLPYFTDRIELK